LGWNLERGSAEGPDDAFIRGSLEFAHQHRVVDGSMHMLLPSEFSAIALERGWGVIHPIDDEISGETSTYVMIYGPRNRDELKTVWIIAQISYYQARGLSMEPKSSTAVPHTGWG
jgi:phospholipase/carboxylesterase